jgi:hypothetical protein
MKKIVSFGKQGYTQILHVNCMCNYKHSSNISKFNLEAHKNESKSPVTNTGLHNYVRFDQ